MKKEEIAVCLMIDNYLAPMLDVEVSYDEIQKMLFFLKEIGEELNFNFDVKSNYPISEEVDNLLNSMIIKKMIKVFVSNDYNSKSIEFCDNTLYQAYNNFKLFDQTSKENFKKVENIISNFETPYGLRLLSAVYILKYLKNKDINFICNTTKFAREQIQTAIAHLNRFF